MKEQFRHPVPSNQNLSVDIPLDKFVTTGQVHDYAQMVAATFAVTAATPAYPGFSFDGATAEIVASVNTVTAFATLPFSVFAWIKPSANTNVICGKHENANGEYGWNLGIDGNDKLYLMMEALSFAFSDTRVASTGTITANVWTFVGAVKAGTGANDTTMYINGVASGTGQSENVNNNANTPFSIGSDVDGNLFTGEIGGIRIYQPKALSAAEILSLYSLTRWRYSV